MTSGNVCRWIAAAALAPALTAVLGGCGGLSREELSRGVQSLSSLAAQGELVANGVARDATKSTYARVMANTLGGEADHEAEKLADSTPESRVKEERDAAIEVAGEISDLFSELATYPGDEHHGELVERHMREVKEQAEAIVSRLEEEK